MKKRSRSKIIFWPGLVCGLSLACQLLIPAAPSPVVATTQPASPFIVVTSVPGTSTATLRPSPRPTYTPSLTATLDATQKARTATASAVQRIQATASQRALRREAIWMTQFRSGCTEPAVYADVSSDGHWLAESCGNEENQTMVVQNKTRTRKWVLDFKDFLHRDNFPGDGPMGPGTLRPKFWSPDGKYLFFTTTIGYSGGGNACFPGYGTYSLFRLDLMTGRWTTLIQPTAVFPGYEIEFSPNGRWYASDVDGLMITDLQTGAGTTLRVYGTVQEMIWSPDGLRLAYSEARCGRQGVEGSWVYIWENFGQEPTLVLFSEEGIVYKPRLWIDNSLLKIEGEQRIETNRLYSIYLYDLTQELVVFNATVTPSP